MRFSLMVVYSFSLILCLHLVRSEPNPRRVPTGFLGMRGKRSTAEDSKPSLFYEDEVDVEGEGFRGTPQIPLPAFELQFPSGVDGDVRKRAPSMGFVGMRGKKPWDRFSAFYDEDNDRMLKRAPSGFFGMRGKKSNGLDSLGYDHEKRMNSGFFGMRGKKDNDDTDSRIYVSDKRAPSMGFVGMRGRKNYDDPLTDYEKRAPSGFFGMRGKKQWPSFALRGKKIPYQFRGKFVGVRGKKSMFNKNDGKFETENNYDSDMNQLMTQLMDGKTAPKTGTDSV